MSIDLEQIRSANPIDQVVGEKFTLKRQGTRFVGVEHDSLVVMPQTEQYFWNSKGEYGDVFDFVGRHLLELWTWLEQPRCGDVHGSPALSGAAGRYRH